MLRDAHTVDRQLANIAGFLGPLRAGLDDPLVVEILLNEDGKVFHDLAGRGLVDTGIRMEPTAALTLVGAVARYHGREVTYQAPVLECELPVDGSRFTALIPPVATAPVLSLRKRALRVFTLRQYVESGIATEAQAETIREAIAAHRNILIAGATGSGKSTLVNAVLAEIAAQEPQGRLVIIEDTHELQCAAANKVILHTQPGIADINSLVQRTMRLRPDRIVVGEVRGKEALEMLKAWGTGHPGGVATIHAETPLGALLRLERLVAEAVPSPMPDLIADTVHYVVSIQREGGHPAGRRIQEIARVSGYEQGKYLLEKAA